MNWIYFCKKTIEDTKGVTRSIKLKDRQCNCQKKKDNNDIYYMDYYKMNNTNPLKPGLNTGVPEQFQRLQYSHSNDLFICVKR